MTDARRPRILLADDEKPFLDAIEMTLRRAGYEVITASDGEEALQKAVQQELDLVLTDYRMPLVDGLELCRRLLADPRTRGLPVVVMTTPWCTLRTEFESLGNVVRFIEKSFSLSQIVQEARSLIGDGSPRPRPAPEGSLKE